MRIASRSFRSGLALLVLAAFARPARADVTLGAIVAHSPDDISGFATLSGNESVVNVTLPFTFTVEGVNYTTLALSTNGWIEFGTNTSGGADPNDAPLPTSQHTNPFLAAYWNDLSTFGTNIRYGTVGNSPNRTFIADFEVDQVSGSEGADDARFQVQLHERSNLITVRYRDVQSAATGASTTIGFQGAGGGAATAYPIGSNAVMLDDNRPNEGWSVDVGRAGRVRLASITQHSPDDISGFLSLTGDDATANVTLPFSVTIEGASYNTVALSTNGWIEFGGNTAGDSDFSNDCLPTGAHTNPFLAAYWDDMETFGTNIRYGTVGSAGNRVFVVDYEFEIFNGPEGSDDTHMQVRIHERSSLIDIRYRDKQAEPNGQAATIGFQGAGGAVASAHSLACNGKILDDNEDQDEGWSVDPRVSRNIAVHGIMAHSRDDITGFTTLSGNDNVATVVLPFGVTIDGTSYGSVAISTNGWIEFGGNTAANSTPTDTCLPTSQHTNPFLAAYWDDMTTVGSNIRYGTVGSPGGRVFIVDFQFEQVSGGNDVVAQVQIHEGSNVITTKLISAQAGANGQAAVIGFQGAGGGSAVAHPLTCNGKILDDNRDNEGFSVAPMPVCGNGLVEGVGGEQCDLGGANGSSTSCCTSSCQFRASSQVCRPGGGAPCDLSETCTGASSTCPGDDAPGNINSTCRVGSSDVCDPDEVCNGVPGVACPADVVTPNGTQCRAGSGDVCDPAEACTGIAGQTCPANVVNGGSTVCRTGSGDTCDTDETCPGVPLATCPADDAPLNTGVVCRAGSGDVCDANETCTGTPGATCPSDDAPGNTGVICRPSSVDGAFCDENELCDGTPGATCPPNDAPAKVNVVCRAGSGDLCDPDERCTGIVGQGCPADIVANPTVVCRAGSGDACDPDETCTAIPGAPCPSDVVTSAGTPCRAATGTCDIAEDCTGTAGAACPTDAFTAAGTTCDADADVCTEDECDGSGACILSEVVDCEDGNACTQDSCDPINGCQSTGAPSLTCMPAVKATFQVKDNLLHDTGDSLKMRWQGGPVLAGHLGDPTQTTNYELCIYDAAGVQMAMGVPAGAGWKAIGLIASPIGYKYKDSKALVQGVKQISLKTSSVDKAKLLFAGKGVQLPEPALPFLLPVTAQLHASTGYCWDAEFGPAGTQRNEATQFRGKTPAP